LKRHLTSTLACSLHGGAQGGASRGYAGTVTRRPTVPLLVAIVCVLALALTAVLALASPAAHGRDAAMLHGFIALDGPRVHRPVNVIAHLVDPLPYAVGGLALVLVALARGLPWRAGTVVVVLGVTGACTQIAKHVLAQPRFEIWLGRDQIAPAAWPSGHATAAMTLALCAVLVAPPALRLLAAVCGGAFATGIGYALLVLGWHYPSDVLGGFLMAGVWTALAVAFLRVVEPVPGPVRAAGLGAAGRTRELVVGLSVAVVAAAAAAIVAAAPRDEIALYAAERPTLVVGTVVIAALAGALALGFARAE
jgi:membrane-associated phospholipid phosphatase